MAATNLLNGEVDWVYEEELYSRSNYFWSPDGKQIVFLQMNEKDVPDLSHHRLDADCIATVDQEKYPQPGDPNPGVRLGVVGTGGGKVKVDLQPAAGNGALPLGNDPNVLIPRFGWVRDGMIWAMVLNRVQDRLDLYFVDVDKRQVAADDDRDAPTPGSTCIPRSISSCCRPAMAICGRAGATATITSISIASTRRIR